MDYQFYKSLYEREQDLRIAYDNRIEPTITLTVAIATADAFLCNSIAPWSGYTNLCFFAFLCVVLLGLLIAQITFVCKAYISLKFRYKDFPVDLIEPDIENHMKQYKEQNPKASEEDCKTELAAYIPMMLEITYSDCATVYYKENIRRRKAHFWLNIISAINTIAIIALYVIIFVGKFF